MMFFHSEIPSCPHNGGIECAVRDTYHCESCGWNPVVRTARVSEIRTVLRSESSENQIARPNGNLVDVIDTARKSAPPTYEELLLENARLREELRKEHIINE